MAFNAGTPTATFMAVMEWDYPNQREGTLVCDEAHIYTSYPPGADD